MSYQSYERFKELPWFKGLSNCAVFIGGAGGIGSHLAFMLARTGANIIIVDNDTVDKTNLAGQLFGPEEVGLKKVTAVTTVIKKLCDPYFVTPVDEFIDEKEGGWKQHFGFCDIVCAVFDNIKARKILYDEWVKRFHKESNPPTLFVDARMSAENGQVFVYTKPMSEDLYKERFFNDSEVVDQPCTMKATTHCGSLIASLCVAQITNWCTNLKSDSIISRSLPEVIEFHLPVMYLKTGKEGGT